MNQLFGERLMALYLYSGNKIVMILTGEEVNVQNWANQHSRAVLVKDGIETEFLPEKKSTPKIKSGVVHR